MACTGSNVQCAVRPLEPYLSRRPHIPNRLVIVDGLTRTGKSLVGPILGTLHPIELLKMDPWFEYLGTLFELGKLSEDAAIAALRLSADTLSHEVALSRNINMRFADTSSIWKSKSPLRYIIRLLRSESSWGSRIAIDQGKIIQNMTHDQLPIANVYFSAFGARLRFVEVCRHPIALIDSWLRRGWGYRFGLDRKSFTICFDYKGRDLPFYARGFTQEYLNLSPDQRAVRMIHAQWGRGLDGYFTLDAYRTSWLRFFTVESIHQDPHHFVESAGAFLGATKTRKSRKILRSLRLPRKNAAISRSNYPIGFSVYRSLKKLDRSRLDELVASYEDIADSGAPRQRLSLM